MRIANSMAVAAIVLLAPVRGHAQLAPCDCGHLKALQAELRNAIQLRNNFQAEIAALQGMEHDSSASALSQFARAGARRGVESVPGYHGPDAVDYTPQGANISGTITAAEQIEMCEPSAQSKIDLQRARNASACAGVAAAIEAHEQTHWQACRAIGYSRYADLHGAARAAEEVAAYSRQIAILRAELGAVLEHAEVSVEARSSVRLQMPLNPIYSELAVENQSRVRVQRSGGSEDQLRFEGQGQQTTQASVRGNCRFERMPIVLRTHAGLETDGLDASVRFGMDGTVPSMTMTCTIPGGGRGFGTSMPVPAGSSNGDTIVTVPFQDGASAAQDLADAAAGQMMGRGGVRMSGQGSLKLIVNCPLP